MCPSLGQSRTRKLDKRFSFQARIASQQTLFSNRSTDQFTWVSYFAPILFTNLIISKTLTAIPYHLSFCIWKFSRRREKDWLIFVILHRVPPISQPPLTTPTTNYSSVCNPYLCGDAHGVAKKMLFTLKRQRLVIPKQNQVLWSHCRKCHGLVGGGSEKGQPK